MGSHYRTESDNTSFRSPFAWNMECPRSIIDGIPSSGFALSYLSIISLFRSGHYLQYMGKWIASECADCACVMSSPCILLCSYFMKDLL